MYVCMYEQTLWVFDFVNDFKMELVRMGFGEEAFEQFFT